MRVIKVGGSLFDLPDLKTRLQNWLADHNDMPNVLIAGGGKPVDAIRNFQTTHGIDDTAAHWLCLRMMSATAAMLGTLLPDARITDDIAIARNAKQPETIFAPHLWLQKQTARDPNFCEQSWNVTSDSIAVMAGLELGANEIVLLKSVDYDSENTEYLDRCFPHLAKKFKSASTASLAIINFKSLARWQVTCARDTLIFEHIPVVRC